MFVWKTSALPWKGRSSLCERGHPRLRLYAHLIVVQRAVRMTSRTTFDFLVCTLSIEFGFMTCICQARGFDPPLCLHDHAVC